MERQYRFFSVIHAINYFRFNNPARSRSINLLEASTGSSNKAEHFSGDHPHDVWSEVCFSIRKAIEYQNSSIAGAVFGLYFLGERDTNFSVDQLAKRFHTSKKRVRDLIDSMLEQLERELARRELLEPEEH